MGFGAINLVTQRHHLTAVLRKRNSCNFGCKGWCNVYAILRMLRWSFRAMAAGAYPPGRHDGPWREADARRVARAGERFKLRFAVLYIKGD